MSTQNNRVFQVLVTSGNQAVLPDGSFAESLGTQQLGIFNADTGESDAVPAINSKIYFAIKTANGDYFTSTGQYINSRRITAVSKKLPSDDVPQVMEIKNYKNCCGGEQKDYVLKVTVKNERILRTIGYNPFSLSYIAHPNCGDDCASLDINEVTKQLVDQINSDEKNFLKAEPIDELGNVITDMDAYIATNKAVNTDDDLTNDVGSGIRLTTIPEAIREFCATNFLYSSPRETVMEVVAQGAFKCCGTVVEETQEPVFSSGHGYDVGHMEWIAAGWNQNLTSVERAYKIIPATQSVNILADKDTKYVLYTIEYEIGLPGMSINMPGFAKTIIAVPEKDSTTIDSIDAAFNGLGYNFAINSVFTQEPL